MIKNYTAKLLVLFLVACTILNIPVTAHGQTSPTPTVNPSSSNDIQSKINEYQAKISELQDQSKTLTSQIAVMDNQIKLTSLKIESTQKQISDLTLDIDTTDKKINKIASSLDGLTKILINKIVATYVVGSTSSFQALVSSNNISDFVKRANYLRIAQAHDKKLIYDTVQAKNDYANQKTVFEDKKTKIEALSIDLENYNKQLAQDKSDKDALLKLTQIGEATYQQKLQAALAEQKAFQGIVSGGGNAISEGPVKEGDVVGYQINGRSACSSGTHLHFEVRKDGALNDSSNYLSNKSVTFDNSPDGPFSFTGSWNWPLSDSISIEQGFGMTYYARTGWYGGGPHTGIDMYSLTSAVRAVKEGTLYRGSISCGGGQLSFARVDQADGVQIYYMHILP